MNDKIKILRKLANALNANDYESADKIIERDLKRFGLNEEYYFYKALIAQDFKIKRELYTKAIDLAPNFMDAYLNRGLVNNELQDYEASISDYNKAIELDSKCALAYNNRGYTKYKQRDFEGALADYNKAIILNPKMNIALDNKAKLVNEVCLEDESDFVEKYYLSLGIWELNEGNLLEAIKNLDNCINFNEKLYLAYFYKGIAYQNLGNNDEAYRSYTKTIELNKNMIDAYYNRGQLLIETNPKLAIDDFVTAVAMDNKFIDAYYSLAVVQKKLGLYQEAVNNLNKIIEIEPHAVNAKALKKLIENKYLNN